MRKVYSAAEEDFLVQVAGYCSSVTPSCDSVTPSCDCRFNTISNTLCVLSVFNLPDKDKTEILYLHSFRTAISKDINGRQKTGSKVYKVTQIIKFEDIPTKKKNESNV